MPKRIRLPDLERIDIVAVIGRDVALEADGRLFRGACRLHQDDRRNLIVDPEHRWFHCVGCGAAGHALEFYRRLHKVRYEVGLDELGVPWRLSREPEPDYVGPQMPAFVITREGEFVDVRACPWPVIKVGRLASAHLRLDDAEASRMHAVIEVTDQPWLIDPGSAYGTLVNEEPVLTTVALQIGDVIRIGNHELQLVELVQARIPNLEHEAALASARLALELATRSLAGGRFDDARAQLRLARAHVRDPAMELARVRLGIDGGSWAQEQPGIACWLDADGLAQLDALIDALPSPDRSSDEGLRAAMEWPIRRAPEDDGPRLVYADWLQQHGDPRGQFIALSVGQQRSTLDNAAQQRMNELLDAHGARWAAEFHEHGAAVEWKRGFPVAVEHPGLWSRALIGLVRHWTTVTAVKGPWIPDVLAHLA